MVLLGYKNLERTLGILNRRIADHTQPWPRSRHDFLLRLQLSGLELLSPRSHVVPERNNAVGTARRRGTLTAGI